MQNVNPKTQIRYGIVSVNSLIPEIWDDIYEMESITYNEALADACKCLWSEIDSAVEELAEIPDFVDEDLDDDTDIDTLLDIADKLGIDTAEYNPENWQFEEEIRQGTIDQEYRVILTWLGGAPMLVVCQSPDIVRARLCSPCVPNAGDLDNLDTDQGFECYGLPACWYAREEV